MSQKLNIRKTLVAQLNAWPAFVSKNLKFESGRERGVGEDDLPHGFVYANREQDTEILERGGGLSLSRRESLRTISISISVFLKDAHSDDVEDRIDVMLDEVEKAVLSDTTINSYAKEVEFEQSRNLQDASGAVVLGAANLVFNVTYLREIPVDGGS